MTTLMEPETEVKNYIFPRYHVILLNDDDHSFLYVIKMMKQLFGYIETKGTIIAKEINETGRAIVWTGSKEVAEFKQDQIHSFGPDPLIERSAGSMSAELEPEF